MYIRKATTSDVEAIRALCFQLGYSPDLYTVQTNIEMMLAHSDYELVVVQLDSSVVGWMSLAARIRIEDVSFLQVAGIVTDERFRGKGLGRLLMDYAYSAALKRKLSFVGLYSSVSRVEAHIFYERMGYSKSKGSFFFRKDIQ